MASASVREKKGSYSFVTPAIAKKGEVVASPSISGPVLRLSEMQKAANLQAVLNAASYISTLV